jgi:hypothetical protein
MKNRQTYAILAIAVLMLGCILQEQLSPIKLLISKKWEDKKKGILELFHMQKDAIPLLIDSIDNPRILRGTSLVDPIESSVTIEDLQTNLGVLASYLIEWIIAVEDINTTEFMQSPFLLGNEHSHYIYSRGKIMVEGREIFKQDLRRVKSQYQSWWEVNRSKSMDELRSDWQKGTRPLSGSKYHWE